MAIINVKSTGDWFQRFKGAASAGNGSGSDANNPVTHLTFVEEIGEKTDAAVTNPASAGSSIGILKGVLFLLSTNMGQPDDDIADDPAASVGVVSLLKGVLGQLINNLSRSQSATTSITPALLANSAFTVFSASTSHKRRVVCNNTNGTVFLMFGSASPSDQNFSEFLYPGSSLQFGPGDYFGQVRAIALGNSGSISATFWS